MLDFLYIAQSGSNASRVTIENATNNIANVNTPGYKKRVVELSELEHFKENSTGRGVSVDDIIRITNEYLYDNLIEENTKEAYYGELSTLFGQVESIFQETETSGLSKTIDSYFKAIDVLSSNKDDLVFINNYITQANTLVSDLKRMYAAIEDREAQALESVKLDVDEVNSILKEIAAINKEIGNQSAPTNDLLDKRDLLEKQLSNYVDIEVDRGDPYVINIGGERAVWEDNARTFSIGEEFTAQKNSYVADDGRTSSLAGGVGVMDADDKFVFTLDNVGTIELTFGQTVTDSRGNQLDINGDGVIDGLDVVDNTNYVRALSVAINNDPYMNKHVTAYNGDYSTDIDGNIIVPDLTNERYLVLEAKNPGIEGKFESTLEFKRADAVAGLTENIAFDKNDNRSEEASDEIYLQSFDRKIPLEDGSIQAKIENLSTDSGNNKFQNYKDLLDSFAFTLSDIHNSYAVSKDDGDYIYGQDSFDNVGTNIQNEQITNLFSGSSVETLQFNQIAVKDLTQNDLDYLITIQHKSDISFENGVQNSESNGATSFSKYFQALVGTVSRDKESNDFLLDSQESIVQSLSNSYDGLVKVDSDQEQLNLIKFQAAFEASAKMITIVDQMLQTLIGLKQ